MNPHNVETFAVSSIRRKGKRRIILTDSSDQSAVKRRTVKIPDDRMRDIKCFIKEYEGTLLISFDAPPYMCGYTMAAGLVNEIIKVCGDKHGD